MTPDRAREVLQTWLSMTPSALDDICLSPPARLAVESLSEAQSELAMRRVERRCIRHAAIELIDALAADERASKKFLPQIRRLLAALGDGE